MSGIRASTINQRKRFARFLGPARRGQCIRTSSDKERGQNLAQTAGILLLLPLPSRTLKILMNFSRDFAFAGLIPVTQNRKTFHAAGFREASRMVRGSYLSPSSQKDDFDRIMSSSTAVSSAACTGLVR